MWPTHRSRSRCSCAPTLRRAAPFGAVDTPANNAPGVVGSIGVTGWALDDIGVIAGHDLARSRCPARRRRHRTARCSSATPYRSTVPGRMSTRRIRSPFDFQAGWGYLLLTNMLPNQGNGTFKLFAYADDVEGHRIAARRPRRSPATTLTRPSRSAPSTRRPRAGRYRAAATSTSAGR